jgi:hypothetical protein
MCVRCVYVQCFKNSKLEVTSVRISVFVSIATCKIIETGATVFNSFQVVNWY